VALSMDEQRILDEMERRLADDDPRLASRLASFSSPGLSAALRSPRTRLLALAATLAAIAVVALTVYSMMAFRAAGGRNSPPPHSAVTTGVASPAARSGAGGQAAARGSRQR
jgi:Protein of unknown function (DUF3040)